jgi:hypothetical protein
MGKKRNKAKHEVESKVAKNRGHASKTESSSHTPMAIGASRFEDAPEDLHQVLVVHWGVNTQEQFCQKPAEDVASGVVGDAELVHRMVAHLRARNEHASNSNQADNQENQSL